MKGQSAMEFLIFVSISAVMLAVMYGFMADRQVDAYKYQNFQLAQSAAEKASFQVEMALVQEEGYSRVFTLPAELEGEKYNISMSDRTVSVRWRDRQIYRSTLFPGEINLTTTNTNQFRVVHNESGVFLQEVVS